MLCSLHVPTGNTLQQQLLQATSVKTEHEKTDGFPPGEKHLKN